MKNNQRLQKRGEGAFVVTLSLYSLTTTTSWARSGDLTTYLLCAIGIKFYDTLVIIQSGGVFKHLDAPKVRSYTREVEFDSQQGGCIKYL